MNEAASRQHHRAVRRRAHSRARQKGRARTETLAELSRYYDEARALRGS
jgi:hypothetical protein